MKTANLLKLLKTWARCESGVDTDGTISPSLIVIHIIHYYFIVSEKKSLTAYISAVKEDNQGGALILYDSPNKPFKYLMHIIMSGHINFYTIPEDGDPVCEYIPLIENRKGFGTEEYKFE